MTYIQYKNSLNGGSGLNYVNCIIQVTIHIHSHKLHFGTVHGQSSDECIYMFNSVVYLLVSRSMVHSGLASMTDNRLVAKEQYI